MAVGSTWQSGWRVPVCLGAIHQAGPERLDRPAPSSAEHPGEGREQKMDGVLDRQKVAIMYGVLHCRNWFMF